MTRETRGKGPNVRYVYFTVDKLQTLKPGDCKREEKPGKGLAPFLRSGEEGRLARAALPKTPPRRATP